MLRRALVPAVAGILAGITGAAAAARTVDATPGPATPAGAVQPRPAAVIPTDTPALLAEIRRPGAVAVLVNVWATWCDPCRAEMPRLARFFRAHRAEGLRLVLISADEEGERDSAASFLAAQGVDIPSWLKRGDDRVFIDALDPRWTGALPASLLFDGTGHVRELWQGEVTQAELERGWAALKGGARAPAAGANTPKTTPPKTTPPKTTPPEEKRR